MKISCLPAALCAALLLPAVGSTAVSQQVFPPQGRTLQFLGRYATGLFDQAAAEVVSYDPATKRAFLTSAVATRFDAIDLSNPKNPTLVFSVDLSPYGSGVNSVAVKNGVVVCAVEAPVRTNNGSAVFFTTSGQFLKQVTVGAQPDMICFSPDGTKVLTANEGEPSSNYSIDPEGSVTVIDISTGVQNAVATTVGFSSLNNRRQELLAKGIRIFGPNATVAQDFEPEYIAFSSDGTKAYVTLQENDAIAVINLTNNTLSSVEPLGTKDWSKGQPRAEKFTIDNRPLLGTTAMGQQILLGGFSGLWFEGYTADGKMKFLTLPDRGPNAEPATLGGVAKRPFALPDYQARFVRFELDPATKQTSITQQILLTRPDGVTPISGRPNLQAFGQGLAYTDEFGVDLFGNAIPNDELGGDLEGIAVGPDGTFWTVDEYRPAIYNFATNGTMIARYIPAGTAAAGGRPPGTFGTESLPALYAQRRFNRGFEAVAIEGNKLYGFIQSGLDSPDLANDNTSKNSDFCRIVEFDLTTKTVTGEFIYPIFERAFLCDKIGDAASLGNGKFMVIERDDATGPNARKYMFEMNLFGATNTFINPPVLAPGKTVETSTYDELIAAGVRPVFKRKAVHLASIGYDQSEKVEGLARINDTTFAVINDNDFGVGGSTLSNPPNGLINVNPTPEVLGIVRFDRSNTIDVSDRDGAGNTASIKFGNWPIYGVYMPDGIASFPALGSTYYITANEGDARDYTGFQEERRINDATRVPLNPLFFPNAATLRQDANLGRLNVTSFVNAGALTASSPSTGDLDGNGTFEMLHAFGGRSFSIWNAEGNLVWDSGDDLERRTAFLFPNFFNVSNTNNNFDSRSTSKGPEPEGVTIGVVNGRTWAFICNERVGGISIWDVTTPQSPVYVDYLNTRNFVNPFNFTTSADLGPEVVTFIPAAGSPNGLPMLLAANEISGTVSAYQINPPTVYVSTTGNDNNTGVNPTDSPAGTGPKQTVQAGISGVANGGRVNVAAGTYNENLTIAKEAAIVGPEPVNSVPQATINGGNGTAITAVGPDNKLFQRVNVGVNANQAARVGVIPAGSSGNVVLVGNAQVGGLNMSKALLAPFINDVTTPGSGTGAFLLGPLAAPASSLFLRLDASTANLSDGAPVSQWNDLAGGDDNATQSIAAFSPTYRSTGVWTINGYPALQFGANKGLGMAARDAVNGGGEKTIFAVFKTGSNTLTRQVLVDFGGLTNGFNLYVANNNCYAGAWDNNNTWLFRAVAPNTVYLAQFVYDGTALKLAAHAAPNGTGSATSVGFADNFITASAQGNGIGAAMQQTRYHNATNITAGLSDPFQGAIAEVLAYNSADAEMREQTFAYLNQKYGIGGGFQPLAKGAEDQTVINAEQEIPADGTVISPNPASDVALISFQSNAEQSVTLELTDMFGRVIATQSISAKTGVNTLSLNVSSYTSGVYAVRIAGMDFTATGRLIVTR